MFTDNFFKYRNKLNIKQAIDFVAEAWKKTQDSTVRGLGVLVNDIPNIIPIIFIDNYNKVQYDLMNYINDEIFPHTKEILNDTQIINLVQNEEVPTTEDNTDNEEELTPKVLPKEAFDAIKKIHSELENDREANEIYNTIKECHISNRNNLILGLALNGLGSSLFNSIVPQKRCRQNQFREPKANKKSNEPINEYEYKGDISPEDNMDLNDDPVDLEFTYPNTNINIADSWILTWIFKYQARFCLPDIALDSLINCNTLYNIADIVANEGFKCMHIEFPGKILQNGIYCAKFENTDKQFVLETRIQATTTKWTNRDVNNGMLADIYDDNMLMLGLLPGPSKVKLHKINHYLALIIDELLEFWDGIKISAAEKNIRFALICCSNDISVAKKLCSHISASVSCHRCYKTANSNGSENKSNFGGFDDMVDWFVEKQLKKVEQISEILDDKKENPEQHVQLNDSMLLVWASYIQSNQKKQKTNALPKTTGNNLRSQLMIIYQMSPPMPPMYNSYQHGYYSTNSNYTPLQSNHKERRFSYEICNFIDNGYTVDLLGQLKDIGVDLAGHRIKILVELGIKIPN
ncbi:hypothetical protein RhiirA1_473368 [Rhizophagus irregularis]|uniref:Uncharacterized protein n=1 Tax=Rhizophagus irregularis TaxID=588596 RepID=A0A2N0R0N5_9GLOM|nr:hypothetical protein RhiirA1_473368 [Rhizophagus irregularis]